MREFQLHGEEDFIKLGQLLKAEGLVDSGVEAKYAIEEGKASVNGEVCTMRGRRFTQEMLLPSAVRRSGSADED